MKALFLLALVGVIGIIRATLTGLLSDELKAWVPWMVKRLVRNAVAQLPENQRERYQEEWESHLEEVPGDIAKMVVAAGFFRAAWRMSEKPHLGIVSVKSVGAFIWDHSVRLVALIMFVEALPLVLLVGLLIRLTSEGPILLRQRRVGFQGRSFDLYKFRTTSDTALGKFLREARLDKLPRIWNVLSGHMALVGPRPERPEFVAELSKEIPGYDLRHTVRPGITGWAQINCRYGSSVEAAARQRLLYDLFYIRSRSPGLDLLILFHTVGRILYRRED